MTQIPTTNPSTELLADPRQFGIIQVSGPDAAKFLQGQLSCDVVALQPGDQTLGAYCNIKGKIESLFRLWLIGDNYYLRMNASLITPTLQELKKYAIFSKVTLQEVPSQTVDFAVAESSEQFEIAHGIPELYPQTVNTFFPHDLNLPALGAVSFTKGCYRGQEIIARMQHRGKLKRSLYLFEILDPERQIQPGVVITSAETDSLTDAGTVVRVAINNSGNTIGLAVITDALAGTKLLVAGQELAVKSV